MAAEIHDQTTIRLHDGEQVTLTRSQAERIYDELWLLASRVRGAIAAASKLKKTDAWTLLHGDDALNEAVDSGDGFVAQFYGTAAYGVDAGQVFPGRWGLQEERVRGLGRFRAWA